MVLIINIGITGIVVIGIYKHYPGAGFGQHWKMRNIIGIGGINWTNRAVPGRVRIQTIRIHHVYLVINPVIVSRC